MRNGSSVFSSRAGSRSGSLGTSGGSITGGLGVGRARSTTSTDRSSDSTSTDRTSLRQDGAASGSNSTLATKTGGTRKVASITVANLLVVKIEHEGKLLSRAAEGVRTVGTGRTIGSNTITGDLRADVLEKSLIILRINLGGNNTRKGVIHALADAILGSGRQGAGSLPVRKGRSRAFASDSVGGSPRLGVDARRSSRSQLLGKVRKVSESRNCIVLESDKTVVVILFKVHVDDTAGPDVGHLRGVEGRDIIKSTRLDDVAAILGEENRDGKVGKFLSAVSVTRGLKIDLATTPLVHVDAVKVSRVLSITAGKVVSKVATGIRVIVSGVTDRNAAVIFRFNVSLGITNSGLDKGRSVSVGVVVGNFVTSKETENVGVLSHFVDNSGVTVVQLDGPAGAFSRDGEAGLGKIGDNVDAVLGKQIKAFVVVNGGVDGVDTDNVGLELLEVRQVTLASGAVSQGVGEAVTGGSVLQLLLVSNTSHEELSTIVGVEELVTLDDNFRDIRRGGGG